jgi:hypothetical protein
MEPSVANQNPPFQGRRPTAFEVSERWEFILSPPARDAAKRTAFSYKRAGSRGRRMMTARGDR